MDDEVIGYTLGIGYGIKHYIINSTDMVYSIKSSEWSGTGAIQSIYICKKSIM